MSARNIPKYVAVAGWEVWSAYAAFLDEDDLDRLRDSVGALRDALLRDPSTLNEAPDDVLNDRIVQMSVSGRPRRDFYGRTP